MAHLEPLVFILEFVIAAGVRTSSQLPPNRRAKISRLEQQGNWGEKPSRLNGLTNQQ
jgi:hypothetical protein